MNFIPESIKVVGGVKNKIGSNFFKENQGLCLTQTSQQCVCGKKPIKQKLKNQSEDNVSNISKKMNQSNRE